MRPQELPRLRSGVPGRGLAIAVPAIVVPAIAALAVGVAGCARPDSTPDPAASGSSGDVP